MLSYNLLLIYCKTNATKLSIVIYHDKLPMKNFILKILILLIPFFFTFCENNKRVDSLEEVGDLVKQIDTVFVFDTVFIENSTVIFPTVNINRNWKDSLNLKQGTWITYYEKGLVKKIENYINDTLNGLEISYPHGDSRTRIETSYLKGKRHGYVKEYSLKGSSRPKWMSFYQEGVRLWMLFPSSDIDYTLSEGFFIKGFQIFSDSVNIIAPYDNGNIWYEGTFVRNRRVGLHKIYYQNNKVKWLIDCTNPVETIRVNYSENGDTLAVEKILK